MIVLIRRLLVNLDTGLTVAWCRDERGEDTATIRTPITLHPDFGGNGFTLDADTSARLWAAVAAPSFRDRAGIVALGDGE